MTTPLSGMLAKLLWSTHISNLKSLSTPITKISKTVQNLENWAAMSGYGSLKVTSNVIIRQNAYEFPFNFTRNRNYVSVLYRFRDIASKYVNRVIE